LKLLDRGFLSHIAHESDYGPCDERRPQRSTRMKRKTAGRSSASRRGAGSCKVIGETRLSTTSTSGNAPAKKPAEPRTATEMRASRGAVARATNAPESACVEGRKEIKLPDLAFLASWREQIPVLDSHGPPENLRKLRKPSTIVIRRPRSVEKGQI
jgi:hypothetical protein